MVVIDEKLYKRAFKEVLAILNIIPDEYYDKIPKEIILTLEQNQDDSYEYELEINKEFSEQNISEVSKAILSNFYRDYWSTTIERSKILEKENIERIQLENEKREKYEPNNIFKNKKIKQEADDNKSSQETAIIEYEDKNFIQKIFDKIKHLFEIK